MASNKQYENVKLPTRIVNKLRKNKKDTGVAISTFVEMAIEEKLESDRQIWEQIKTKSK